MLIRTRALKAKARNTDSGYVLKENQEPRPRTTRYDTKQEFNVDSKAE